MTFPPSIFNGCPSILISPALSFKQSKLHSTFETVVWYVKNSSLIKEQRSRAHRKKISFVLAFARQLKLAKLWPVNRLSVWRKKAKIVRRR